MKERAKIENYDAGLQQLFEMGHLGRKTGLILCVESAKKSVARTVLRLYSAAAMLIGEFYHV